MKKSIILIFTFFVLITVTIIVVACTKEIVVSETDNSKINNEVQDFRSKSVQKKIIGNLDPSGKAILILDQNDLKKSFNLYYKKILKLRDVNYQSLDIVELSIITDPYNYMGIDKQYYINAFGNYKNDKSVHYYNIVYPLTLIGDEFYIIIKNSSKYKSNDGFDAEDPVTHSCESMDGCQKCAFTWNDEEPPRIDGCACKSTSGWCKHHTSTQPPEF